MDIQHVFFDLDHTLWDFEKNSALTFQKIFRLNNLGIDNQQFLEAYKPINLKFWKLFREDKISKEALRYTRLKTTFDAINFTISDEVIYKLSEDYIKHLSSFTHLLDGTIEVLTYLKSKYKLHILTNGFRDIQHKKLVNSKIYHYFDKIISSESVGVKKPNPNIFYHALQVAKASTDNAIMIGDSLEADVLGAIGVGLKAIHCCFDGFFNNQ